MRLDRFRSLRPSGTSLYEKEAFRIFSLALYQRERWQFEELTERDCHLSNVIYHTAAFALQIFHSRSEFHSVVI